jgi:hypothetical protein
MSDIESKVTKATLNTLRNWLEKHYNGDLMDRYS